MGQKLPTIRDIAHEAGVSISAVSHAFNRPEELSPDVRDRILRLAKDRGYRPDPRARGLRRDESSLIALLISDLGNVFNAALAKAVQQVISEHGYILVVLNSGTHDDECRSLGAVAHERMAGAIVSAYSLMPEELSARASGRPLVFLTDTHESFAGPTVRLDNFAAAVTATTYLASKGRRRIAHMTGLLDTPPGFQRCAGYRSALEDLGLGPPMEVAGNFIFANGRRAMEELLSLPEPPDAVFAANDVLAFAALRVLRERGIAVPNQIAVVGFDNIEDAAWSDPPLTTIDQPVERIGATAATLLLSRLKDPHFTETVDVPYALVERGSV
jgi:LacI family repressor for deo operon, udp, cdd, tsx, nupC, and nupG